MLLPVRGYAGDLEQRTCPDRSVGVSNQAQWRSIYSSIHILVFNDHLHSKAIISCCCDLTLWSDNISEKRRTPERICWPNIGVYSSHSIVDPYEMTTQDTHVFIHTYTQRCPFANIFYPIVPAKSLLRVVVQKARLNIWNPRLHLANSKYRSFIKAEMLLVNTELSLHSSELAIKNTGSNTGQYGGTDGTQGRYFCPKRHAFGYIILAFLFISRRAGCGPDIVRIHVVALRRTKPSPQMFMTQ